MSARQAAGWAGLLAAESVGRLVAQIGVTAILARIIAPEEFGLSALALSVAASLAILAGGIAFEEALVQGRVVRRGHYESALAISWAAGLLCLGVLWLASPSIAAWLDAPNLEILLLIACALVFAQAPLSLLTALARRRRRFGALAWASLLGHALGAAAALAMGLRGFGAEALVVFRIAVVATTALILHVQLRVVFVPRFSRRRLADIGAFSGLSLAERSVENAVYLLFNYLAGALYGLVALGHLNMAMRVVEPLRGAFTGIAHNIAFPFLRATGGVARRGEVLTSAMHIVALIAAPAFFGLAAVGDAVITLVAGPGWTESGPMETLLAIGAGLAVISGVAMAATNAHGAPWINLVRRLIGFATLSGVLVAAAPLGVVAAALARLAADGAEALWCLGVAKFRVGARGRDLAIRVGGPSAIAALMALGVHELGFLLADRIGLVETLALQVAAGATVYLLVVAVADGAARDAVRGLVRGRSSPVMPSE